MGGIVVAFLTIWALTAVGWLLDRYGVLGPGAEVVLARLVFFVLNPALLLSTLAGTGLDRVFTGAGAAFVVSTVVIAALAVAATRWTRRRSAADTTVAALAASYVNAGNLGIPVAAYVLGDVAFVVPVLLFQVLLAAPLALAVLDAGTAGRVDVRRWVLLPVRNPMILASAAGLAVAVSGWQPPEAALRPVSVLGGAAVPAALLALGMSLHQSRGGADGRHGADVWTAVSLKVLAQPAVAYLVGRYGFALAGPQLLAAVLTAGLPAAQNVFVYATRYGRGVELARDAVALSTVAAAGTLAAVALWLG